MTVTAVGRSLGPGSSPAGRTPPRPLEPQSPRSPGRPLVLRPRQAQGAVAQPVWLPGTGSLGRPSRRRGRPGSSSSSDSEIPITECHPACPQPPPDWPLSRRGERHRLPAHLLHIRGAQTRLWLQTRQAVSRPWGEAPLGHNGAV